MTRTVASIALDLQASKGLALSGRQFDVLCSILRSASDPEEKARELALMQNRAVMELVGERRL